ncbi:MAG: stage III sporulation protein AE [Firmicutes bacterium]|nr:stage III sporulation protein AE [Bacillota bacterium]
MEKTGLIRLIIVGLALLLSSGVVWSNEYPPELYSIVEQELAHLKLGELTAFLSHLDAETQELLPTWNLRSWATEGLKLDFSTILRQVVGFLSREVLINLHLLGKLIILAVIGGVLVHFQQAWAEESLGDLVYNIIYLILMGLAVQSFTATLQLANAVLDRINGFVLALLPPVFTLLAAAGGVTLATVCHPVMWGGTALVISLVKNLVLPLILLAGMIGLVSRLAEGFTVTKLGETARQGAVVILGFLITIFLGLLSLQGVTVAVADGLGLKAAKFLTGNLMPLVGKTVADSLDLAAGCSLLIKNALGVFGALGVILICVYPSFKILVVAFIYRFAAVLVQPLGQERLAESLQEIGKTIMVIFAAVAVVGLMFFFSLTILVGLGNLTAVVR